MDEIYVVIIGDNNRRHIIEVAVHLEDSRSLGVRMIIRIVRRFDVRFGIINQFDRVLSGAGEGLFEQVVIIRRDKYAEGNPSQHLQCRRRFLSLPDMCHQAADQCFAPRFDLNKKRSLRQVIMRPILQQLFIPA